MNNPSSDEQLRRELNSLVEALRSLENEGWFAAWSDDPRVIAIRRALEVVDSSERVK